MTTATTTTAVNHTTSAGFQAWYNEVIAQLTAVGLTQTTDTGQIGATAAIPASSTAAGYTIWKFNDTLQSTSPLFLKLEFGTAAATTAPGMWMTLGTGSNGSGTLTGTLSTRVQVTNNDTPLSSTNLYVSRFMYSATLGILWVGFKYGSDANVGTNGTIGGFVVSRSNDSTGASTGDAVFFLRCSYSTAVPSFSGSGFMQSISYLTSTIYPSALSAAVEGAFAICPFIQASNAYSGDVQVYPVFYMSPLINISANVGIANLADISLAGTFSTSLVGSTAVTFIQAGMMLGTYDIVLSGNQAASQSSGFILPWQ